MDWNHELLTSLIWLSKAFAISIVGLALIMLALSLYTSWGRQFKRIAWDYFTPARSMRPLVGLALVALLALFSVRMNVLFSFWYNSFYSAMQKLDAVAFGAC